MLRPSQPLQPTLPDTDGHGEPYNTPSVPSTQSTTVSHMSYSEMVGFYQQQVSRIEMAWFRIMYLHAALVGVLVFFESAQDFLVFQRTIVFAFYSVNLAIFRAALSDGYQGLNVAQQDLMRFPEVDGHVDQWFRRYIPRNHTGTRTAIMFVTWAIVGFLLFRSVLIP